MLSDAFAAHTDPQIKFSTDILLQPHPDMADIIGLVSSTCSLISFTKSIIDACAHYYKTARGANNDILSISSSVYSLKKLLENVQKLGSTFNSEALNPAYLPFLRCLEEHMTQCDESMEELGEALGVIMESGGQNPGIKVKFLLKLKWPLKEKQVERHLQIIERVKTAITLILNSLAHIYNRSIGEGIAGLQDRMVELTTGINNIGVTVRRILEDDTDEQIRSWLKENAPDSSLNHCMAREKYTAGTGKWLLESQTFTSWLNEEKRALWIHGIPGAGKTIICSSVIEKVKSLCNPEHGHQYAYFYFDATDKWKQVVSGLLYRLIQQLCPGGMFPGEMRHLYRTESKQGIEQLSTKLFVDTLVSTLDSSHRTFLIVDALDECSQKDEVMKIILRLARLESARVSILVSSREEREIREAFKSDFQNISLDTSGHNADIVHHIATTIYDETHFRRLDSTMREEVYNVLRFQGKGMYHPFEINPLTRNRFRLVECQLDILKRLYRRSDVQKALKTLPRTLDETYDRILQNIPAEHYEYTRTAIQALLVSFRPLTVKELAEALTVNYEKELFDFKDRFWDPHDVLEFCSTLISSQRFSIV